MAEAPISGFADDRFAAVREAFADNLAGGADIGASVAITIEGEPVVDLWGGWTDESRTRPWQKDSIVNVYSTTKTMTALAALLLADRGELDLDSPVARYWPEFAANGKSGVTTSHLLAHAAGLSGWKEKVTTADLYDWDKATSLLAAQAPFWEPGTASGYHSYTQGYLVGEVVRRITGRSVGSFFREEIAEPLGADFHIGFGPEHDGRVVDLIPPTEEWTSEGEPTALQMNVMTNPPIDPRESRTRDWRAAEIPAAGGHGNARSIALIHTLLANGGVANGKRLMSEAGCRKALEPQVSGTDLVIASPVTFGLGFAVDGFFAKPNPAASMFWGGYGGSLALIDMDARTSFGYAMNRMGVVTVGDPRALRMAQAMWQALGLSAANR